MSPFELQGTTLVGGLSFNGPSSGQIEMTWSGSVDLGGLPVTFSCLTNGLFQTDYHQLRDSSTIPPTNNNCTPSCSMGECCANSGPLGTGSCLSVCSQESCNGNGDCDPAP